eukprot:1157200-Pelagomonas_calceolata.AAC.2
MGISKPRFHDVHTLSVESLRALGVALPVLTGKIIKYVSELMTRRQPIRTTERSVASDAEKLVAPVLPGTEAPPGPGPSKGIHKSMLMKLCRLELFRGAGWEQLTSFSQLPNIVLRPAVLPTALEATISWNQTACKTGCKLFNSTSHCLPRPTDTAGLPILFVWEGSQSMRAGGAQGGPGQPGVNFTGKRQT